LAATASTGLAAEKFLYLTTVGRKTGLPREIEIWFVAAGDRYYVLAEGHRNANWLRNIERTPQVRVRIAAATFGATATVLDPARDADRYAMDQRLMQEKYGWGEGLPCPSSDHLRLIEGFINGGFSPSGLSV